ncbi:MAG: hypothetical protein HY756_08720 [Nitrospirae bacterium]|nr:hypothetical protein [Nitrospirota bacterium]
MIKKLLYLLIFFLMVQSGIKLAMPYYRYYAFKSDVEEIVKISVEMRPEEIMANILSLVSQYNIPLKKENIYVGKNGIYSVKTHWKETVNIYDVYKRDYKFFIDTANSAKESH